MSKAITASFTRRMPDNVTEELVAVLSSKASFEFKPLFDIILMKLRERNAASGGGEKLRARWHQNRPGAVGLGAGYRRAHPGKKKIQKRGARRPQRTHQS